MTSDSRQSESGYQGEQPRIHTCDGCGSWTDRPVLLAALLSDAPGGWGWVEGAEKDDNREARFCPECT